MRTAVRSLALVTILTTSALTATAKEGDKPAPSAKVKRGQYLVCLLYTSPSPRDS